MLVKPLRNPQAKFVFLIMSTWLLKKTITDSIINYRYSRDIFQTPICVGDGCGGRWSTGGRRIWLWRRRRRVNLLPEKNSWGRPHIHDSWLLVNATNTLIAIWITTLSLTFSMTNSFLTLTFPKSSSSNRYARCEIRALINMRNARCEIFFSSNQCARCFFYLFQQNSE